MPSLDGMPDETLLQIFQDLSQHDKASVTRVCKKVSHAALTLLYENPDVSINPETYHQITETPLKAIQLLRTVSASPQLAYMVKKLDALSLVTRLFDLFREEDQIVLAQALRDSRSSVLPVPTSIDTLPWSSDLPMALLFHYCPAVRLASLGAVHFVEHGDGSGAVSDFEYTTLFELMKHSIGPAQSPPTGLLFAKLRSLELCGAGYSLSMSIVLPVVFALPALEELTLVHLYERNLSEPLVCEREASTVKSLIIHNCSIRTATINTMVLSCKALRHFGLSRGCRKCHPNLGTIDLPALYSALREHSHALETLSLSIMNECGHRAVYEDPPFLTLAELHSLRLLYIPAHTLFRTGGAQDLTHLLPARLDEIRLDVLKRGTLMSALHHAARLSSRRTQTVIGAKTYRSPGAKKFNLLRKQHPNVACLSALTKRFFRFQSRSQVSIPAERLPRSPRLLRF